MKAKEEQQAQGIRICQMLTMQDKQKIEALAVACQADSPVQLKLELDYKLALPSCNRVGMTSLNEFFHEKEGEVLSYVGLSCFDPDIAEITGMTHPDFRRNGLFRQLMLLALQEAERRSVDRILMLTDAHSGSGKATVMALGGQYAFSEMRMRRTGASALPVSSQEDSLSLRPATLEDWGEMASQDVSIFGTRNLTDASTDPSFRKTWIIGLGDQIIGKIKVNEQNNQAFLYGFGINPSFRGQGFGRAALTAVLRQLDQKGFSRVELDVEYKNETALNLYRSCGFSEVSEMMYFSWEPSSTS